MMGIFFLSLFSWNKNQKGQRKKTFSFTLSEIISIYNSNLFSANYNAVIADGTLMPLMELIDWCLGRENFVDDSDWLPATIVVAVAVDLAVVVDVVVLMANDNNNSDIDSLLMDHDVNDEKQSGDDVADDD